LSLKGSSGEPTKIIDKFKRYNITSAIKHVKKFCAMPVVIENGDHAFIYLFAGAILSIHISQARGPRLNFTNNGFEK